jgi:hypothetical protein
MNAKTVVVILVSAVTGMVLTAVVKRNVPQLAKYL